MATANRTQSLLIANAMADQVVTVAGADADYMTGAAAAERTYQIDAARFEREFQIAQEESGHYPNTSGLTITQRREIRDAKLEAARARYASTEANLTVTRVQTSTAGEMRSKCARNTPTMPPECSEVRSKCRRIALRARRQNPWPDR